MFCVKGVEEKCGQPGQNYSNYKSCCAVIHSSKIKNELAANCYNKRRSTNAAPGMLE